MMPKVAIVSDPLVQRGGAERVVEVLAEMFPDAPIFSLLYTASTGPVSIAARVVPSFLNRIPGGTRRHRWLFPLYPYAVESFDFSGFDVIISSHHSVAKNVLRGANQYHLCYCHTPMRALWEPAVEGRTVPLAARPLAEAIKRSMRVWDYSGAARVDDFIANGRTTQRRIAKHYGRESTIVSPPIDTERFQPTATAREDFYLIASRLIPYKRVDIAVAASALAGRRLIVVGSGPGASELRGSHIDYRGHVSDAELVSLMQRARAMIFPAYEDFGMAMVEMMACGGPIIGLNRGGALETVIDGITGRLASSQTPEAFARAIVESEATSFDAERIRQHALGYARASFVEKINAFVDKGFAATRL